MRIAALLGLCLPLVGCYGLQTTVPPPLPRAPCTAFAHVGRYDFRAAGAGGGPASLADFEAALQPGDLVVAYLDPHRAVLTGQLPFVVLPCGHSLIAVPGHCGGMELLEARFLGARTIRPKGLRLYSRVDLYRLADPAMLDLGRLREFADVGPPKARWYDFGTWIGWNASMRPDSKDDIAAAYSCAGFSAAAYYYSGVMLAASAPGWRMVTPQNLIASIASPRHGAVPRFP